MSPRTTTRNRTVVAELFDVFAMKKSSLGEAVTAEGWLSDPVWRTAEPAQSSMIGRPGSSSGGAGFQRAFGVRNRGLGGGTKPDNPSLPGPPGVSLLPSCLDAPNRSRQCPRTRAPAQQPVGANPGHRQGPASPTGRVPHGTCRFGLLGPGKKPRRTGPHRQCVACQRALRQCLATGRRSDRAAASLGRAGPAQRRGWCLARRS